MLTLLILAGMLLPLQDSDSGKPRRFRNVMVLRATATVVKTDREDAKILARLAGLTVAQIPAGSTKAFVTSTANRTSEINLDSIDEIDFSGGMTVRVQVLDDAVEVDLEEDDEPVAVVVYVEKEGEKPEIDSATIVYLPGKTRIPVPPYGVAYLLSPSGVGSVLNIPSLPDSSPGFLSTITISTGGIFGFDMNAEDVPQLSSTRQEDFTGPENVTQTFQLDSESFSLAKLRVGFDLLEWLQVGIYGFTGSFDAEGKLVTIAGNNPGEPQNATVNLDGSITGFGLELWFSNLQWSSASFHFKSGGAISFDWLQQEYDSFGTPKGDVGVHPVIFDYTSDFEGETESIYSVAAGIRSTGTWTISPSMNLGFHIQPQWSFGDLGGFSLDGGLSFEIRF